MKWRQRVRLLKHYTAREKTTSASLFWKTFVLKGANNLNLLQYFFYYKNRCKFMHQNGKETTNEERNHLKSFHGERNSDKIACYHLSYISLFSTWLAGMGMNKEEQKQNFCSQEVAQSAGITSLVTSSNPPSPL